MEDEGGWWLGRHLRRERERERERGPPRPSSAYPAIPGTFSLSWQLRHVAATTKRSAASSSSSSSARLHPARPVHFLPRRNDAAQHHTCIPSYFVLKSIARASRARARIIGPASRKRTPVSRAAATRRPCVIGDRWLATGARRLPCIACVRVRGLFCISAEILIFDAIENLYFDFENRNWGESRIIKNWRIVVEESIWYWCFYGVLVIVRFEEKDCWRN